MRPIAPIMLLAIGLSVPLGAQTLTEQLQKGIYTEEMLGDREGAARIYRQIIAAPAVPRAIALEAERRLARLPKSDQSAVKPATLPTPSDIRVTMFAEKPRDLQQQGRYRHLASGITFDVPPGWTATETYPSSDGGDGVTLTEETTGRAINVWMIQRETQPDRVALTVGAAPAEKIRQRHSGYGIPGMLDPGTYDIPSHTVQPTLINGQHAVVAVATYRGIPLEHSSADRSEPMNEYMTWIYTPRSRAFFYARVRIADLPRLRPSFDQIVQSAVIP